MLCCEGTAGQCSGKEAVRTKAKTHVAATKHPNTAAAKPCGEYDAISSYRRWSSHESEAGQSDYRAGRGQHEELVLVAELQDGVLRYRGHGIEPSKGMRKGLIAELGPAAEAINRAALTAERVAKAGIETAVVGIGGTHVRGVNSRGGISMGSRMREITREEVRAAVDRARSRGAASGPRGAASVAAGVHPG